MRLQSLLSYLALAGLVSAHGEFVPANNDDLAKYNREIQARSVAARKCSSTISNSKTRRMVSRRDRLTRRQAPPFPTGPFPTGPFPTEFPPGFPTNFPGFPGGPGGANPTGTPGTYTGPTATYAPEAAPHYNGGLDNATCVLHPETVEGPYYIRGEQVRTDLREDQGGIPLILDIGVLDIETCQPISNAFVELWNCNSTGFYGGYSGMFGAPDAVHKESFLRGGYFTNDDGVVEITTLYPGFYQGRTTHIHAMVHTNWAARDNGTLVSDAGSVNHIGQFFFEESWNDKIFAEEPYKSNTQVRTLNSQDGILQGAGPNAFVEINYLEDENLAGGVVGYITVVVNKTVSYVINNQNQL